MPPTIWLDSTVLKDGTKWCYIYDVTKQIKEAPNPYEVEIVLDKLPVPTKIGGNSGFTPGVSDWNIIRDTNRYVIFINKI